jgi:hypothetical protein
VSKKLEVADRVAAILPGLKDLRARDWVATHHADLITLPFDEFMVQIRREFLSEGWDDELHAKICSSRLKISDSFMSWVNELHHLNIILQGMDYHFNDDSFRLQLDSLIDTDLRSHSKNHRIKESVDAAVDNKNEKTAKHVSLSGSLKCANLPKSIPMTPSVIRKPLRIFTMPPNVNLAQPNALPYLDPLGSRTALPSPPSAPVPQGSPRTNISCSTNTKVVPNVAMAIKTTGRETVRMVSQKPPATRN